ncbi:hypothetical protein QYE76_062054 [Lolium multiflorum]|uniref:Transposon protein, putative, CACTA, En/Spm sub-class n=1 Tax=Lolium multiflorum TaxID=4521 RepID=A0AAD8S292_LOLMU|nr:hypothetical protein QYE76_062054 [Lolium multiflorum]
MMEDGDEEEDNDDQYRSMFSECNDTAMDDNEEEGGEEQASDDPVDDDLRRAISDARRDCGTDKERLQFDKMLEDHHKLLYPEVGVTDSGFEKLMIILKKLFPRNNELPVSTYEAKKLVCPLGLDVQKIHACINDCILYRGEKYENLNKCPICGALRYKIRKDDPGDVEGEPPRKRVPAKVMWYAPIIPRLKRLFRNKEHAQLLRWHMEERKKDAMLRHPADGRQWRNIGREFPDFAGLLERDIFDLFLPEFDKPWVIHLRETCCCSTNLSSWGPNTVYKNRSTVDIKHFSAPPLPGRKGKDKTLLDTTCSGSFTSNKEEFKRDLLDRIKENAEDWENDKGKESGYADKPPFKPLPPKEGNEEKGEEEEEEEGNEEEEEEEEEEEGE